MLHLCYGRGMKFLSFPYNAVMVIESTLSQFCCFTITVRYCWVPQSNVHWSATQWTNLCHWKHLKKWTEKSLYYKHILSTLPNLNLENISLIWNGFLSFFPYQYLSRIQNNPGLVDKTVTWFPKTQKPMCLLSFQSTVKCSTFPISIKRLTLYHTMHFIIFLSKCRFLHPVSTA